MSSSGFFVVLYLHQGQIMYIQMLYATDRPSGTLTLNGVQDVSGKLKR